MHAVLCQATGGDMCCSAGQTCGAVNGGVGCVCSSSQYADCTTKGLGCKATGSSSNP